MPDSATLLDSRAMSATALSVAADAADVARASAWLARIGAEQGIPPRPLMRLDHCLDEVLANIIAHGGAAACAVPITLDIQILCHNGEGRATLIVSDGGVEFNPLAVVPPSRPTNLAEAEPGGLGLLMLRKNSDQLSYSYCQGRNRLSIAVFWPAEE